MTRLYFVATGRVQGVGFRWFVLQTAQRLGVTGWVRNRDDGAVEGEVEGMEEAVRDFLQTLQTGHPYARVDRLTTSPAASRKSTSFEIR